MKGPEKIHLRLSAYLQCGPHNYNFPTAARGINTRCRTGSAISCLNILRPFDGSPEPTQGWQTQKPWGNRQLIELREEGQVEDNRTGFSWRRSALPPAIGLRMQTQHLPNRPPMRAWRLGLASRLQVCNLWPLLQVQAPAQSPGDLCDHAPDTSQDLFPAIRCSRHTTLVPTSCSFTVPCFGLCCSFTWSPGPPHHFHHHLHLAKSYLFFNIHVRSYQLQESSSGGTGILPPGSQGWRRLLCPAPDIHTRPCESFTHNIPSPIYLLAEFTSLNKDWKKAQTLSFLACLAAKLWDVIQSCSKGLDGKSTKGFLDKTFLHDNKGARHRTPFLFISAIECTSVRSDIWSCSSHLATTRGKPRESKSRWSGSLPSLTCWTDLGTFSSSLFDMWERVITPCGLNHVFGGIWSLAGKYILNDSTCYVYITFAFFSSIIP